MIPSPNSSDPLGDSGWSLPSPGPGLNDYDSFGLNFTRPFDNTPTFETDSLLSSYDSLSLPPDFSLDQPYRPDTDSILPTPSPLVSKHRRYPSSPARVPLLLMKPVEQTPLADLPVVPTFAADDNFSSSHSRQRSLPVTLSGISQTSENSFLQICKDRQVTFNPQELGFIPVRFWNNQEFTFGELVSDFFQRKNNANSRFSHKLYNALKIATKDRFYVEFLGVEWVNHNVLKVNKHVFARLLGIKIIDGSLFHTQGNFPSHGFVEIGSNNASTYVTPEDLEGVDFENVRLLYHHAGVFVKGCKEEDIERCKWISSRRRN